MRYFWKHEMQHLIERSDLKLENIYGDFDQTEVNAESKEMVIVCSKRT